MRKQIWDAIAEKCRTYGISKYQLIQLSGVPERTVYRIKDDQLPKLEQLVQIANAVGIEVEIKLNHQDSWKPPVNE